MNDSERSMKYFILFSIGAAVLLPVGTEVYANLSRGIAAVIVLALAVTAGIRFGLLPPKKALLGCSAFLLSSIVLSMVGFAAIHPAVKSWLTENSKYFEMTLLDWVMCWAKTFAELGTVFPICFAVLGIRKLCGQLESGESSSQMIDDAFSEDGK